MLTDGTMRPVAIDGGPAGIVLATEDGSKATRLWHSSDGVVWERLPDLPEADTDTRVHGLVAYAKGWVAHGADAAGDVAFWTSTDGIEWKRIASAKLQPFEGTYIADIVSGGEGIVAFGRTIGDTESDRIWTSPNGRRWRERVEFARVHPGASLTVAGSMGYHFVTFGRAATGKPAVWVGSDHTTNYITRQWRGSAPKDPAPPSALHVGRDAGLAVVASAQPDGRPELWRSINAWDWRLMPVDDGGAGHTAFASDGDLIVRDQITDTGGHSIDVTSDAQTWQPVISAGEPPSSTAPPLLSLGPTGIVLAARDGVWHGTWLDRAAAFSARPTYSQPSIGPIGAEPQLRDPVKKPKRQRHALDTSAPATARNERGGVRLEMWLPDRRVRSGEWLAAHMRITNVSSGEITFSCGGGYTKAKTAELFPSGERWTGNAAAFKKRLFAADAIGYQGFGYRRGDGDDCPGSVGLDITLTPGEVYEYDVWTVPRYVVRDQPLPSGRLPVVTHFGYRREGSDLRRRLSVRASVRFVGPKWRWATPQELVDNMLHDPRFKDWLDRRDRPIWWDNTTFHVVNKRNFYWTELGFEGPAPDGTVHIGLFAYSWRAFGGGYGRMLLDPWTGQVLGFAT
ncbi:MAG: hypothetical protein U9O18_00090 [Chloroflexota bacterium]|nr:hypothetical protein [Chloroflexota bacterium]